MEYTKQQRHKLYKMFLKQYLMCEHIYVCDIFTDYFILKLHKQLGVNIYRESIIHLFEETKLFLIDENNHCLNFGVDCDFYSHEPKTMGIIFFQLLIEMTK